MKRAAVLLLGLLLAGCGSRVPVEQRARTLSAGNRPAVGPAGTPSSSLVATGPSTSASPSRGGSAAGGGAVDDLIKGSRSSGDFDLTIAVDPRCVRPGSSGVASVRTKPGVGVALMVSYADKDVAGPYTLGGTADAAGRYEWTFLIPPDAPTGPAEVLAGAVDWERGDGATGRVGFLIATAC